MADISLTDDPGLRVTVTADPAELSGLRRQVAQVARATGATEEISDDCQLAVSELATNVINHTDTTHLTVVFRRVVAGWMLDVSNAEALNDVTGRSLPSADMLGGRGLAIASSLMDSVELVDVDGEQHIRCFRRAV